MNDVDGLRDRIDVLERQLRRLRRAGALGVVFTTLMLAGAASQPAGGRARFTEVDVERLNVIEPDGQLVLAMANTARLPDPLIAGKTVETKRTGPGMIFFNGKGWEVGGLIYGGGETADGYLAGAHFSFDQYHSDQVVYLDYQDNGKGKAAGLYIVDRDREPERRPSAQRIFVGSANETAMVRLRDRGGRDRILMSVSPDGVAQLEFRDAQGNVVERFPK
jgi:hypothetical protein